MRHAGSLALRLCGCALLMVATAVPAALAQSVSGTILGTVTDSVTDSPFYDFGSDAPSADLRETT